MANNVVGSLLVNLGLETGRLNSDTKKAARHFNSFDKKAKRSLSSVGRSVSSLMASMGLLTGAAGALSVAGFGLVIKSSLEATDKIGKLSTRIGASTEALSQYRHVAELSGVEFDTLTMGWQRMTRRVSEAAGGFGEAKGALKELNLSATDLNQLKPEQQFEAIAQSLSGVGNKADKVRLAMKLFDSEGVSLLQMMENGADGLLKMRKEADELGSTLSKEDALGAAGAIDAIARLDTEWDGFVQDVAIGLSGPLTDLIGWMRKDLPRAVNFALGPVDIISESIFSIWEPFNRSEITPGLDNLDALNKKLIILRGRIEYFRDPSSKGMIGREEELKKDLILYDETEKRILRLQSIRDQEKNFRDDKAPDRTPLSINVSGAGVDDDDENDRIKRKLGLLENSLMSEEERLWESYANRQFIVEDAFERDLINETKHQELLLGLKANFEDQMTGLTLKGLTDREKFQKKSALEQTSTVLGEMQSMTNGIAQHSKTAFKINKTASLANAVISGYESFNKTMAAYPYPINVGMAALGAAATGAQIQAIRATSFNGGGSGTTPSAAGGGGQIINDTPVQTQPQNEPANQGRQITINIEGNILGTEDGIRDVVVRAIEQAETNDEIRLISNG